MRLPRPAARTALATALALATLGVGCGYSVRPPFRADVRTVYLPMFKTTRFRRDQQQLLTKLLQEEIERRTPYKVVGSPEGADTRLEGTIVYDDKNAMVESPSNLPRQILASLQVTVTWTDNRTDIKKTRTISPPAFVVESSPFFPELGETSQLGFYKVMQSLVRDIVNMMEEPWGEEFTREADESPRRRMRR